MAALFLFSWHIRSRTLGVPGDPEYKLLPRDYEVQYWTGIITREAVSQAYFSCIMLTSVRNVNIIINEQTITLSFAFTELQQDVTQSAGA
jgi:hypothetical protein